MIPASSSNPVFQEFENQRVKLQNGIESCTDFFSLDPQPWIHDLNTISASFQNNLEDDLMHDLALITAQAAMKRLKNFHWILNTGKELSLQMHVATEKFKTPNSF